MKAPEFWREGGPWPSLLAPFGGLYALAGRIERAVTRPVKAAVPVICVGNLTAGGSGKTPVAMAVAQRLARAGRVPHVVTRGYGGRLVGPVRVDPKTHRAADVGDEALLLARECATWVARDRVKGSRAAAEAGAKTIVLDDGFQDPRLAKDVALVVADGETGFGNGRVIPAGPLRESAIGGLERAQGLIIVGPDGWGVGALAARFTPNLPVLAAYLAPTAEASRFKGRKVLGFAGIGIPEKFLATLREVGAVVVGFHAFADHHMFSERDLNILRIRAKTKDALLVTTAKDAIRIAPEAKDGIEVLEIVARFTDEAALDRLLGIAR